MGATRHLKGLLRTPAFTILVIVTLGIGIGANTAIFSVIEGILLRPLPYPEPDRLINVDHAAPGVNVQHAGMAAFLYFTYRDEARTLADIGMWTGDTATLTGQGEPEELRALQVTDGILPMLGARPALGRLFTRHDDSPDGNETVVLTHGFWQSKFGGRDAIVGTTILLDGRPREVIGVLPAQFRFLDQTPAIYLPARLDRKNTRLGQFNFSGIARLRTGATIAQASAELSRLIPIALDRFPPFPGYDKKMFVDAKVVTLLLPLKEWLTGDIDAVLWVLMGTVGVVLLIACANVANLLLVRAEGRHQELAIRSALGASRRRLVVELLVESLVLALAGGILGTGFAAGALRLLRAFAPSNLPRLVVVGLDPIVLAFAVAVSLGAGLLFGAIPAIRHAAPQLATALRAGGRSLSSSRERRRARSTLVVVQIALALVLLVGSGLMIRTFVALRQVDPGFTDPSHIQTLSISIPEAEVKDPVAVTRMEQQMLERIAAVPGVRAAGVTTSLPTEGGWHDPIFAQDKVYQEGQLPPVRLFKFVSPGLLSAMGHRLVAGREFTWADLYEMHRVAIVSEGLAREMWQQPSAALGKRIRPNLKSEWREVIGVVADVREDGVNRPAPGTVIWPILMDRFPFDEALSRRSLTYVIRTDRAGTSGLLRDLGQAVWSVNGHVPLAAVRTMKEIYDRSLAQTSFTLIMLALAGGMALLLGIAGIYGVISYSVSQRTREIGVRMALGAQVREVTGLFVRYGVSLAVTGIAVGLVAAFAVSRLLASLLFDVAPTDPLTYVAVSGGLAAAAALASYLPALRATAVDPVDALRAE
jgi:predicted permease